MKTNPEEEFLSPESRVLPAGDDFPAVEPLPPPATMEEPAPETGLLPAPDGASPEAVAVAAEAASPGGWAIFVAVLREVVETIVLALVMVFLIQMVIRNFRVEGHSMAPNLQNGQYLVVDKLSYKLPFGIRPPRRGDVVVFVPPHQPDRDFVKRIIGLPGETVEIRRGQVYINGELLPNTFGARLDRSAMPPTVVPEGALFVLGDNRPNSNDSRNWGMLDIDHVVGRVWLSYWPPERWGLIPNDAPASSATLRHLLTQMSASP